MGESAGRKDDRKDLGHSHNTLERTKLKQAGPGQARPGHNPAALGLVKEGQLWSVLTHKATYS